MELRIFRPKIILSVVFAMSLTYYSIGQAPAVKPQVLASGGAHFQSSSLHLDYTLGEFMVKTLDGSERLTQGFHQPGLEFITHVLDPFFENKIKIYPNPVSEFLAIIIEEEGNYEIQISDLQGRTIKSIAGDMQLRLSLQDLAPGMYVLTISHHHQLIQAALIDKI